MNGDNAGQGSMAAGQPPAIKQSVETATDISHRATALANRASEIADRLEVGSVAIPTPAPGTPDPASVEKPYSNGLTDIFLRQHDRTRLALEKLEVSLTRISNIV